MNTQQLTTLSDIQHRKQAEPPSLVGSRCLQTGYHPSPAHGSREIESNHHNNRVRQSGQGKQGVTHLQEEQPLSDFLDQLLGHILGEEFYSELELKRGLLADILLEHLTSAKTNNKT